MYFLTTSARQAGDTCLFKMIMFYGFFFLFDLLNY